MIQLIAAAAIAVAQSAEPPPSDLTEIRMHLFYKGSGRLSPDISPPHPFTGWNTVIGEGSAEEYADDLLVVAEISTTGHQLIERPLHIVARGRDDRILGERRFDNVLTTQEGRSYQALWLNDVTCEGDIHVTVTYGAQRGTETVALPCGE